MKIIIAGIGYVGASTAVLLSGGNQVQVIDPDSKKTEAIRQGKAPLKDSYMESFFQSENVSIEILNQSDSVAEDADFVIIAVPTDWSEESKSIDTCHIESVVRKVDESRSHAAIVIRSTVPVGFTKSLADKYPERIFIICPEFLREGTAMLDALNPSRLVVGRSEEDEDAVSKAEDFVRIMKEALRKFRPNDYDETPILFTGTDEAEAIKLFSNTFLAARIAFFNELDTYAEKNGLNSEQIIQGMSMDDRIGNHYNNPSFGYGGYCLPKDSRQLLKDTCSTEGSILHAVVSSNEQRKDLVSDILLSAVTDASSQSERPIIGIYRLTAKTGSEGTRSASVLDVIQRIKERDVSIAVYEPTIKDVNQLKEIHPSLASDKLYLENDLDAFKRVCHVIAANRWNDELEDVREKVYTRDIFGRN